MQKKKKIVTRKTEIFLNQIGTVSACFIYNWSYCVFFSPFKVRQKNYMYIYIKHTQRNSYRRTMYPPHRAKEKLWGDSTLGWEYWKKRKGQREVSLLLIYIQPVDRYQVSRWYIALNLHYSFLFLLYEKLHNEKQIIYIYIKLFPLVNTMEYIKFFFFNSLKIK